MLQRLGRRDSAAFEAVAREHGPGVYDLLCWLTGEPQVAEDLTQETFLAAWRGIESFRGEADICTWIHRIARNVALQHARKRLPDTVPLDSAATEPAGEEAARLAEREMLQRTVREALAELPQEQREALVLNKLSGLSHAEVAHLLNRPLGTVKWQIAQGLYSLRAILQRKGVTGDEM
jgi:RNA polymerase sigma-70 factor (ECF subfamily)